MHTGELEQARGGKIQDPGGGGNIDLGGPQTEFAKWVDPLVPRKGYEVQENKDHRSVQEDEGDARLPAEKDAEAEKANQMANEQETRKEEPKKFVKERAKNGAIYDVIWLHVVILSDNVGDEPNNPTTKNNKASQRKCRE